MTHTPTQTWYLLYGGSSPDGLGPSVYKGRTTDRSKAERHYEKIRADPYSTGKVIEITDTQQKQWWGDTYV